MALILLQPGIEPFGQYDAIDGYVTTILGGEICTFTTVAVGSATDKSAADSADGYLNPGTSRVALTNNLVASTAVTTTAGAGPFMLTDDGTAHYGMLFGVVVGGTVGQVASGGFSPGSSGGLIGSGTVLGPHTALGSGKWTCWDKPGIYGVTLDSTDTTLQPTSATPQPGLPLYALAGVGGTVSATPGRLTTTPTAAAVAGINSSALVMGRFIEFRTNNALVTTPNRLVSALNSPSSTVSGTLPLQLYMAVLHFQVGQ